MSNDPEFSRGNPDGSKAPKQPGMFQLVVKAKKWFGSTTANDTAAKTRFTITIGNQCFVHAATKKTGLKTGSS